MFSGKSAYAAETRSNRITPAVIVPPGARGNNPNSGEPPTTRRGFAPYVGNPSPPNRGGERLAIVATPTNKKRPT